MNAQVELKQNSEVKDLPFNEVLHSQCIEYWRVSLCWNGRSSEGITMGEAFDRLNKVLDVCNPIRPLAFRINTLKFDMVEMGSKKRRKAANANQKPKLTVL